MDVTSEKSIINLIKKLEQKKIKIDTLINNACLNPKYENKIKFKNNSLENFSLDLWNNEIKVGLTGSFLCAKHFGYQMKKVKKRCNN